MRRAAKVDANHRLIVGALLSCGCAVEDTSGIGRGFADLLVYHRSTRRLLLVEVKDGDKPPSARKLTKAQELWHARFPVHVVESVEQALALVAGREAA